MSPITPKIKAFLDIQKLGFVATVSSTGKPNISPKGTIIAWSKNSLAFANIRSPDTMTNLQNNGSGIVTLEFKVPSRGMIGFRSEFLTDTKGLGILNSLFDSYAPWFGPIPQRTSGVIVADRPGKLTPYASLGMVDRGELFLDVGTEVYKGMIVGERNKRGDLDVNIIREKKLSNMRSASKDNTVVLRPPRKLSLDQCIEFIAEDELIEITPINLRMRKIELDINKRISQNKKREK